MVSIIWPVIAGVAFLGAGCVLSIKAFPTFMRSALERVSERVERSHQPRDELQLGIMLVVLVCCGLIGMLIGSHLLGAFVAGILYSDVPRSPIVWRRQLKRVSSWLLRLFFAATVAFSVPTEVLFSKDAILHGLLLTVAAALLPKLLAGVGAGRDNAFVVGCAMIPRGEFAYFVAATSVDTVVKSTGDGTQRLMSEDTYAATVWALLASAVLAPIIFGYALKRQLEANPRCRSASIGKSDDFSIRVEGMHRAGLLPEVIEVLSQLALEVKEAVIETDGKVDVQVFTVQLRDRRGEVDDAKLSEIKHEILDAVNDADAQVVCIPAEPLNYNMLEIQLTSAHHSNMLTEITEVLHKFELEVKVATCMGTQDDTDVEVLYAQNLRRPDTRIGGDVAYGVRAALRALLDKHQIKGEVMVKPPKWSQIPSHAMQTRPQFGPDVLKVCVEADTHNPVVLHEVAQELCQLGLDLVTADIENGDHDLAVFYVKPKSGAAVSTAAGVQAALIRAIRAQQVNDCHVLVEEQGTLSAMAALRIQATAEAAEAKYNQLHDGASSSPRSPSLTPLAAVRASSVRVVQVDANEARVQLARSGSSSRSFNSPSHAGAGAMLPAQAVPARPVFEDSSDSDAEAPAPAPVRSRTANMRPGAAPQPQSGPSGVFARQPVAAPAAAGSPHLVNGVARRNSPLENANDAAVAGEVTGEAPVDGGAGSHPAVDAVANGSHRSRSGSHASNGSGARHTPANGGPSKASVGADGGTPVANGAPDDSQV